MKKTFLLFVVFTAILLLGSCEVYEAENIFEENLESIVEVIVEETIDGETKKVKKEESKSLALSDTINGTLAFDAYKEIKFTIKDNECLGKDGIRIVIYTIKTPATRKCKTSLYTDCDGTRTLVETVIFDSTNSGTDIQIEIPAITSSGVNSFVVVTDTTDTMEEDEQFTWSIFEMLPMGAPEDE